MMISRIQKAVVGWLLLVLALGFWFSEIKLSRGSRLKKTYIGVKMMLY